MRMPLRHEFSVAKKVPPIILAATAITAVAKGNETQNVTPTEAVSPNIRYIDASRVSINSAGLVLKAHRRRKHRHLTGQALAEAIVTPNQRYMWEVNVHHCEGDPWNFEGSIYSGGLGIENVNYADIRNRFYPSFPSHAY